MPFFRHDLSGEKNAKDVAAVLDSGYLTSGNVGKSVEDEISSFFNVNSSLLTNSWTNGAITTLMAMNIGPGDEVIVPAMTFISSINVIEMVGATPVLVDVDPDTLLIMPDSVKAALSPRTKAILPVHLYGQMCDMPGILKAISGRKDIRVIEDAAHCFEGTRDGYGPAQYGDVAIFSFYATKNVTCGEGGAIAIGNDGLTEALRQTRIHGMTAGAIDRYRRDRYQHWDMTRLGCKANLPDLLAALLPEQIRTISSRLAHRQALAERYRSAFSDGPVRLPAQIPGCNSAEHAFVIHVPPSIRDDAISALNESGIGVGVHFRSVHTTTYYREKYGFSDTDFPVSYEWGEGTISLPLYPSLSADEQKHVIDTVHEKIYPLCSASEQDKKDNK